MGAGGFTFPVQLTFDILSFPERHGCAIALMDIDEESLKRTTRLLGSAIDPAAHQGDGR
jgi:alpha-galactosidase/6-phospho-beta-glucosidase family protein